MEDWRMARRVLTGSNGRFLRVIVMIVLMVVIHIPDAAAKCGGVDYSWGADALATAHDFTVTMMTYVLYICYTIAGIMVIISALQIYIKMQNGEGEISKNIQSLGGACLFMIGAPIVFPAFFGYHI